MSKYLIMFLLLCSLLSACSPAFKQKDFLNQVLNENDNLGMRIRAYKQRAELMGADGVDYQFQARNLNNPEWREIFVTHHDDGVELTAANIVSVDQAVGLAFVSRQYAVTADRGRTWTTLQLTDSDPSCRIKQVELESDGGGVMTLSCNGTLKEQVIKNFGLDIDN